MTVKITASPEYIEAANRELVVAYHKLTPPGQRTNWVPGCASYTDDEGEVRCDQLPVAFLYVAYASPDREGCEALRLGLCARHVVEHGYRFGAFHELDD